MAKPGFEPRNSTSSKIKWGKEQAGENLERVTSWQPRNVVFAGGSGQGVEASSGTRDLGRTGKCLLEGPW